jgi:hypothetical protein
VVDPNDRREPIYSRVGHIEDIDSQNIVDAIESTGLGDFAGDGSVRPGEQTIIERVTFTER